MTFFSKLLKDDNYKKIKKMVEIKKKGGNLNDKTIKR